MLLEQVTPELEIEMLWLTRMLYTHKHSEFSTPGELLIFVEKLRSLSGGKPVGIKLY